jgi:hypothetical protein
MRIDAEHQSLIITEDELTSVAAEFKLPRNELALINAQLGTKSGERAMKDFDALPGWARDVYKQAIISMASPAQIARINIVYPGQVVSRLALAWNMNNSDTITVVARMGDEVALKQVPAGQAEGLIGKPLDADAVKCVAGVSLKLPAITLVAFLAVIDYAQYDWYISSLKHAEPAESFTLDEIWDRLQDAAGGDYRWPLPLLFSILPVDISGLITEKDLSSSLDYLARAGLLTADDGSGEGAGVFTLSTEGRAIAGSFIYGGARVAMTVSAPVSGGIGHEALLFVRDSDALWLFDLSGNKGAVAGISPGSFHDIMKMFFVPSEKEQEVRGPACPSCGKKIVEGDEFCPECGKPIRVK